jgi:hypothetical protein
MMYIKEIFTHARSAAAGFACGMRRSGAVMGDEGAATMPAPD